MNIKKIGLRAGHSPNCKGAIALRDEYNCMYTLYLETKKILEEYGYEIVDCNSTGNTEFKELNEGVRKANNADVDLFISFHMNKYNTKAHGVEALTHSEKSRANPIAQRLCDNFSGYLGLTNRGVKYKPTYYEMCNVNAPNIIFETMFCDNDYDINKVWSPTPYEVMARLIANAIDLNIPVNKNKKYQVRYYTFSSKEDAENFYNKVKTISGAYGQIEEM